MEEKLNQLITDVAVIKTKLDTLTNEQHDKIEDHENRIRGLESFKNKVYGAIIVGNVLTGIIVSVVVAFFSK